MGEEAKIDFDTAGSQAFKDTHEAAIKAKEAEAEALTGKDNKKARTEKSKEASAMKNDPKYIDACKVVKGLPAPNGNFMTKKDGICRIKSRREERVGQTEERHHCS